MNLLKQFPKNIQQFLVETFGKPLLINKLNGIKAEGGCYRVGFSNHSIIVKQMTKPQEYLFYSKCSSLFKEFRKHIPSLYWSYKDGNKYWIVIEDISYALPKERWLQAGEQVLRALFVFHTEGWGKVFLLKISTCQSGTTDLQRAYWHCTQIRQATNYNLC